MQNRLRWQPLWRPAALRLPPPLLEDLCITPVMSTFGLVHGFTHMPFSLAHLGQKLFRIGNSDLLAIVIRPLQARKFIRLNRSSGNICTSTIGQLACGPGLKLEVAYRFGGDAVALGFANGTAGAPGPGAHVPMCPCVSWARVPLGPSVLGLLGPMPLCHWANGPLGPCALVL